MRRQLIGVVGDAYSEPVRKVSGILNILMQGMQLPADYPIRRAVTNVFNPFINDYLDPLYTDFSHIQVPDTEDSFEQALGHVRALEEAYPGLWDRMLKAVLIHHTRTSAVVVSGVSTEGQVQTITQLGGTLLQVVTDTDIGQLELLPPCGNFVLCRGDQADLELQLRDLLDHLKETSSCPAL